MFPNKQRIAKKIIVTSFVSFLNRLHDEKTAAKRNGVSSVESTLHNAHRGGSRRCKKQWENEQRAREKNETATWHFILSCVVRDGVLQTARDRYYYLKCSETHRQRFYTQVELINRINMHLTTTL